MAWPLVALGAALPWLVKGAAKILPKAITGSSIVQKVGSTVSRVLGGKFGMAATGAWIGSMFGNEDTKKPISKVGKPIVVQSAVSTFTNTAQAMPIDKGMPVAGIAAGGALALGAGALAVTKGGKAMTMMPALIAKGRPIVAAGAALIPRLGTVGKVAGIAAAGGAAALGIGAMVGAGGSIGGMQVAYTWNTGTAQFSRLIDGSIVVQKKNGVLKRYRPARHIVVPRNPRIGTLVRADKRIDRLMNSVARRAGMVRRRKKS